MITFTENALDILREAVEPTDVVRIGVRGGGCSGFMYNLEIETETCDDDIILELNDVKICMDLQSSFMLSETTVDYESTLSKAGFKFINGQATAECGCGESFSC